MGTKQKSRPRHKNVKDGKTRGATLIHGIQKSRALSEIPTYLRQLTYAHTSTILRFFRIGSDCPQRPIVTACVPSGFHHPGLSVGATAAFTSASTVCFSVVGAIIHRQNPTVKREFEKSFFKATPHKCVVGLQPIFSAGNALFFLAIHKVCLRKTAFFRRKISG